MPSEDEDRIGLVVTLFPVSCLVDDDGMVKLIVLGSEGVGEQVGGGDRRRNLPGIDQVVLDLFKDRSLLAAPLKIYRAFIGPHVNHLCLDDGQIGGESFWIIPVFWRAIGILLPESTDGGLGVGHEKDGGLCRGSP